MGIEIPVEKWTGQIKEVTLGAGGRREVTIGGAATLPYLKFESTAGNPTRVAIEIHDALERMNRMLGICVSDDVLDRIFETFCIGK